jgi:predicted dehydrogenase
MADKVRIGFAGAGGIATEAHLPALKEIEGAEIVALADVAKDRAEAAAAKFGGKAYADYHEMLDKEQMDALYVCLPPDMHEDVELIACGKGIHLFVEKPIVLSMKKGMEIAAAIKKAGVASCVGYQLRYWPVADAARHFLKDKAIALVAGSRWGGIAGGPQHWWRVMKRSGGMLHEQATHNLDFIRYVVGDVRRVCAMNALNALKGVENLDIPDAEVSMLEFKSGAIGYFANSCALTKGGGASAMDVILKDLLLRISFSEITVRPEGAATIELPPQRMNIEQAFLHAIRTGDRSIIRSPYDDALKTAEVTLGALESAKTGKPVEMKLA